MLSSMAVTFTPVYLSSTRSKKALWLWSLLFLLSLGALHSLRRTGLFIPSIFMVIFWLMTLFGIIMSVRFAFFSPLLYRVSHQEIQVFYDAKRNGFVPIPLSIPRAKIEGVEREGQYVKLQLKPAHGLEIERFNRKKTALTDTIYLLDDGLTGALTT